jgi:hypothetical protein
MKLTPNKRLEEAVWRDGAALAAQPRCSADTDRRRAMSRRMRVVAFAAILATGSSCGCGS